MHSSVVAFQYTIGDFWSGNRNEIRLEATWRPGPRLNMQFGWTHNDIDLKEGAFTTDLGSLRVDFDFTRLAQGADTLGLERAQQLGLTLERKLAELVDK